MNNDVNLQELSAQELKAYQKKVQNEISKYDNLQQAKKVQLNSAYGAMGNQYFRFYDIRLAEAITLSGQLVIKWIFNDLNKYLNGLLKTEKVDYVIAGDTDSVYLCLEKVVQAVMPEQTDKEKIVNFLDKFCNEKLEKIVDKSIAEISDYLNAFAPKIKIKREKISNRGIWTAKKRYMLNVYDSEGVRYKEPKISMKGIEAIKSSTPEIVRKHIKETIKLVMEGKEKDVIDYIEATRVKFHEYAPDQVSKVSTVNNLSKYIDSGSIYTKGTPIHVRGSLLYNKLLKDKNLTKKFQSIKEGEKIRFVYLKVPNTIREDIISFPGQLPQEFGLHKYIDYDTQFEKVYLEPVKAILDAIGWKTKETNTLFKFFKKG